jgi:exonuclease SbcC
MIPLKLHIKNFLSYGSELQTIDFTPHHLICLSGKNGHGKSALLDAITWALWGVARKTATSVKPDQGLLRLGQNHMMVILDFELGSHTYRVRREFTFHYGKAISSLEFGIINAHSASLVPLTEKTTRDTQRVIEQTINLDCETFINSAFIKQGQSHSFSKKSAAERKEIFATILGLNQYEIIRKRALEQVKEAHTKEKTIQAIQEKISHELKAKEELEQALQKTELALADNTAQELTLQQTMHGIEQEWAALQARKQKHAQRIYEHDQLKKRSDEKITLLHSTRAAWRTWHQQQLSLPDAETVYATQRQLMETIKNHTKALEKCLAIKETLLKHKELLAQRRRILEQAVQAQALEEQIKKEKLLAQKNAASLQEQELQKTVVATQEELKKTTLALDVLALKKNERTLFEQTYAQQELLFEKRKAFYQKYSVHGNVLRDTLKSITQKQELVSKADDAACPLCDQGLSTSRRRLIQQKCVQEHERAAHQYQRLVRILTPLKSALVEEHANLQKQRQQLELLMQASGQHQELEKKNAELVTTLATLNTKLQEATTLRAQHEVALHEWEKQLAAQTPHAETISKDSIIMQIAATISALEKEEAEVHYSKETHQKDEQALELSNAQLAVQQQVQKEALVQQEHKRSVITLCRELKKIVREITDAQTGLAAFADVSKSESNLTAKKQTADSAIHGIKKLREALIQEKGRTLSECSKMALLEKEHAAYQKEQAELAQVVSDYTTIAQATGKDGIQAYLIEEAIPEVEYEANQLLGRLSQNNAQIAFESLRDLKNGGSKETLDLTISDASGTRPYELFSGGEAFRIDFALRIALSKLLARRAGTALQTLIIDEGFGSQDEEGLSNLMDAIHKIQDDFKKVIVVSHLDVLKDQFPVHFVIHKGPSGSSVTVMHQG